MQNNRNTRKFAFNAAFGGLIAALYVVLTWLANLFGLASGAIQVRFSEALTILPVLTNAAVPGVTVGCLLANILTGCLPWDIVFGTLATLLGAVGTHLMRKRPMLAWIPPVLSNTLIIPVVLMKVYGVDTAWPVLTFQIFAGEMISCCLLGLLLYLASAKPIREILARNG